MKTQRGFTLIELLLVVAIIGLLAALAAVALSSSRQKSRDAKRVSDMRQIKTALELYFNTLQGYPLAATPITLGVSPNTTLSSGSDFAAAPTGTTFMGDIPGNQGPGGSDYRYTSDVGGANYVISFTLERGVEDMPVGLLCATPASIVAAPPPGVACSAP